MKFLLIYVPNLRFSNLDKLMKVRLGDICTITGGYAFDSHKMTQKGDYQIIKWEIYIMEYLIYHVIRHL